MKGAILAMAGGATALAVRGADMFDYGCCKNIVTVTVYGSMPSATYVAPSSVIPVTTTTSTSTKTPDVPTPYITTCPASGVCTIAAKTVVVTETKTTYIQTTSTLVPGMNTYGGLVTTVTAPTTVTVPWVQTDIVYVCPTAGTYTAIPPVKTEVITETVVVYPIPWTMTPGTYIRPAQTVTATVTDVVVVCPYNGVYTTPIVTVVPTPVYNEVVYTQPAVVYTQPAVVVYSSPAPAAQPTGSGGEVKVNGNKWAITYTPYTSSGDCKSASAVMTDLAGIAAKGFTTVRLYATDCSGLVNVGAACQANGLKIILGIFIDNKGIGAAQQQVSDISAWGAQGNWAIVSMIVVGNEAIFNGYCSAQELAVFIVSSKATWVSGGYTGTVTTTEPLNILQASGSALCGAIDVVAANIQPFFNSGITASQAGDFVASQLWAVGQVCPGLEAYNLECGWPSAGSPNGAAVPGVTEQQQAISSIMSQVGSKTVFFSFANDYWKAEGSFGVEQSFGCSNLF